MTMADLTSMRRQGIQPGFKYSGRVIDSDDPQGNRRIRARVQDLHNEVPDDLLVWAIPGPSFQFAGAGPDTGTFSVPEVGTQVYIVYPEGDKGYNPTWEPYGTDSSTVPEEAKEDYPYTHILFKLFKNIMRYNKKKLFWFMRFDKDVEIGVEESVTVKVGKDVVVTINGDKTVNVVGTVTIKCDTAVVEASTRAAIQAPEIGLYGDTTIYGNGTCTRDWTVGGTIHGSHD